MARVIPITVGVLLGLICVANACMRPEMDERAVQWSAAIVQAKLVSVGPKVDLGQIQERQGFGGTLGIATTTYFYRLYQFTVTGSLDGRLTAGDKFAVIRLFSITENPTIGCAQHLSHSGIGKEFLLLLRPLSDYQMIAPNGIKKPDAKGAMTVIHLEPMDQLKEEDVKALKRRIQGVRAAEKQMSPATVQRLITSVEKARDDAGAEVSERALEHFGPKVIPAVQAAAEKAKPNAQSRLLQVVGELTAPDPMTMLLTQPPPRYGAEQDDGSK